MFFGVHVYFIDTVKPLNSGNLRVLKNLSVIKRCPLLGGSLTKIVTFETKNFVHYSRHVCYLVCPLLGGFTVIRFKGFYTIWCYIISVVNKNIFIWFFVSLDVIRIKIFDIDYLIENIMPTIFISICFTMLIYMREVFIYFITQIRQVTINYWQAPLDLERSIIPIVISFKNLLLSKIGRGPFDDFISSSL